MLLFGSRSESLGSIFFTKTLKKKKLESQDELQKATDPGDFLLKDEAFIKT